jgi:hypothetical protein
MMELKVRKGYLTDTDDGRCVEWVRRNDAIVYADNEVREAVKREREEIADMVTQYDRMMAQRIRSRGESKPEPRLGTNTPTATAKIMEIKYCPECGTALGIVEANPSKIERIAVPRRTDWEIPTVELADKLNELIDAWNGGKA